MTRTGVMLSIERRTTICLLGSVVVACAEHFPQESAPSRGAEAYAKIVASGQGTCGIRLDGQLYCWGRFSARLAGLQIDSIKPMRVPTSSAVREVTLGGRESCVVLEDGSVECWIDSSVEPAQTKRYGKGAPFAHAVALDGSMCAWQESGAAFCDIGGERSFPEGLRVRDIWQYNGMVCALGLGGGITCFFDELHTVDKVDGTDEYVGFTRSDSPVGYAWTRDGRAFEWFRGTYVKPPRPLQFRTPVRQMVTSGYLDELACALLEGGEVDCWAAADGNRFGQRGIGTDAVVQGIQRVEGLSGVTELTAGSGHVCAKSSGRWVCWGRNNSGQVGDGTADVDLSPSIVRGLKANGGTAGSGHTCAWNHEAVYCWGRNDAGQLGNGAGPDQPRPASAVAGLPGADGVFAHGDTTYAWKGTSVFVWGAGRRPTPVAVPRSSVVDRVVGGDDGVCILSEGTLLCTADPLHASDEDWKAPRWVPSERVVDASMSSHRIGAESTPSACVVTESGRVFCKEGEKRLDVGASAVRSGARHSCALNSLGRVFCWLHGFGVKGARNEPQPLHIAPSSGAVSSLQLNQEVALVQLASGPSLSVPLGTYPISPQEPLGQFLFVERGVVGVPWKSRLWPETEWLSGSFASGAGSSHACVYGGGDVGCVGSNRFGQLGNGVASARFLPVPVSAAPL